MALAKKPTTVPSHAATSKRKATAARKTTKVKTKITKREAEVVSVATALTHEQQQLYPIQPARPPRAA